jgi:hypothetical protein
MSIGIDLQTLSIPELWELHDLVKVVLFNRLLSEKDRLDQRLKLLKRETSDPIKRRARDKERHSDGVVPITPTS